MRLKLLKWQTPSLRNIYLTFTLSLQLVPFAKSDSVRKSPPFCVRVSRRCCVQKPQCCLDEEANVKHHVYQSRPFDRSSQNHFQTFGEFPLLHAEKTGRPPSRRYGTDSRWHHRCMMAALLSGHAGLNTWASLCAVGGSGAVVAIFLSVEEVDAAAVVVVVQKCWDVV